jgi:CRISPR-associated endonuclease/helicase Cas3
MCPLHESSDPIFTRLMCCWGKSGATPQEFHPILYHMLDAAHIAQQLLDQTASPRWQHALARVWDVPRDALRRWFPWLVALHDIGKISSLFQGKLAAQRQRLQQEGFRFTGWFGGDKVSHTHIGQAFADGARAQIFHAHGFDEQVARIGACAIGGHHGYYLLLDDVGRARRALASEPPEWEALRHKAATLLYALLVEDASAIPTTPPRHSTAAALLLTGFTILCDWLASDVRHFPLAADVPLETYIAQSKQRAQEAVRAAGFQQRTVSPATPRFECLFPTYLPPRPLQAAINAVPEELLANPCLAIIEAPTGEGKTEAALTLAHRMAWAARATDEMYYALPTTATSHQMFGRLRRYLAESLNLPAPVKLVHGQAYLTEDDLRVELADDGDPEDRRALLEWFSPLKRSLLAPFGVGTVDQAELAALHVKHGTLRLLGLANKVVIFDEVHAYDTYMTVVVERLLSWLSVLGSPVILLSATLPLRQRDQLACAYGCDLQPLRALGDAYPSIYIGNRGGGYATRVAASQPQRRIAVAWLHLGDGDAEAKARQLLQLVAEEGCACWITNTVARAQQIFRALQRQAPEGVHCHLLHAQYPLEERQRREQEIAGRYGKDGARPQRGIVVGTQVLEQSLDLDFDVMISDLAPVDLLLQRAGRLHRHARVRAAAHPQPKLYLNAPLDAQGDVDVSTDAHVYAAYYLLRTWQLLRARSTINLPEDYRTLVEAVYGTQATHEDDERLQKAWEALQKDQSLACQEARERLLLSSDDPEELLCHRIASTCLFKEDEDGQAWIVARTRRGEESITVIPLELDADDPASATRARVSEQEAWLPLDHPATRETQLRLLRRSLKVSRADVVQALKQTRTHLPRLFRDSPLLQPCVPLWLRHGRARVGDWTLQLDPVLGLVIERAKQTKGG